MAATAEAPVADVAAATPSKKASMAGTACAGAPADKVSAPPYPVTPMPKRGGWMGGVSSHAAVGATPKSTTPGVIGPMLVSALGWLWSSMPSRNMRRNARLSAR